MSTAFASSRLAMAGMPRFVGDQLERIRRALDWGNAVYRGGLLMSPVPKRSDDALDVSIIPRLACAWVFPQFRDDRGRSRSFGEARLLKFHSVGPLPNHIVIEFSICGHILACWFRS